MLPYEKIDVSEEIDTNKTSASKECMLCHYWYFKYVVLMTAYELKNIPIFNVKGVDYRCILLGISKDEAVNILNNSVLDNKDVDKWILVQIRCLLK